MSRELDVECGYVKGLGAARSRSSGPDDFRDA
jgi:hypothetical protein